MCYPLTLHAPDGTRPVGFDTTGSGHATINTDDDKAPEREKTAVLHLSGIRHAEVIGNPL